MHPHRCLVLGGCGFLGSNVVEQLLQEGYRVRVFDTRTASRANIASIEQEIEFVEGNFLNSTDVAGALQDVDFVLHLVGTTLPASSNKNLVFDVESNLIGTIKLLEECVRHRVKRVIFSSSGGTVYGEPEQIPIPEDHPNNPNCSYGITKLAIEKYLRLYHHLYDLDYMVLRLANPYGKHQRLTAEQGAVGVFLACINDGRPITIWGDGSVTRDYIYVEDVANAFVKALIQDSPHRIFNIGTGVGTSIQDLLSKMERITGIRPQVKYSEGRPVDVCKNVLDPTRAQKYLNWRAAIDCEEGLRKTWSWICESKAHVATG